MSETVRAAGTGSGSDKFRAHLEGFSIFLGLWRHVKQPRRGLKARSSLAASFMLAQHLPPSEGTLPWDCMGLESSPLS